MKSFVLLSAGFAAQSAGADYPTACPGGTCPGLGRLFYLPNVNAKNGLTSSGRSILTNVKVGECAVQSVQQRNTREMKSSDSMQELVKETSVSMGLSGSYKPAVLSVGASVDVLTGSSSHITSSFHSTRLDITAVNQVVALDQTNECLGDESSFDADFLNKFKSLLEIDANNVADSSTWAPYVNFLRDQGSHILVQFQIGSRFQQWESTTSDSSDIATTLQVKACANVEGITPDMAGWSVEGCAAYNSTEKTIASKTLTESHRVMLGGTSASRAALTNELNDVTLANFINDAANGDQAIGYTFKPVWETLITFYNQRCEASGGEDCRHWQRAYNLQAAYEGWLAVGCTHQVTSNGVVYQTMAISNPSSAVKTYQCKAAKTGCYSGSDCHLLQKAAKLVPQCYCWGPSCIDEGEAVSGTSLKRDKVRGGQTGGTWDGVNNACTYGGPFDGAACKCNKNWTGGLGDRQLYVQGAELSSPSVFAVLV